MLGGMRMSNVKISKLKNIKDFNDLIEYLRDELDWPIEVEDAEDITFDYDPKELGIEGKYTAKINIIKQIRPLVDKQPWGLFYIEFESKHLPVVVLRRVLRALIHSRRSASNRMKTWDLSDLIFISTLGEEVERKISFAHFSKSEEGLPILRTFSWDPTDTYFHYLQTKLDLEKLSWPVDENNIEYWREKWASAFKLKHREVIRTSKQLATLMANLAAQIREQVKYVHKFEIRNGPLHKLLDNFKKTLIHDLKIDNFADMYAQTIAYGLFSARASHEGEFKLNNISAMIPNTNPFLKNLFEECTKIGEDNLDKIDLEELGVRELIFLLKESNIEAVLQDFGKQKKGEDPVIHFYELFLNEYDETQKVKRGVFYTPNPVVSFIVKSVDHILQNELGFLDGLIDVTISPKNKQFEIRILDPAVGTGTFLQHVIREIKKKFDKKYKNLKKSEIAQQWNDFVPKYLFSKIFGFEIMMAPYAVAHLKLGLTLRETGYDFKSNKRLGIYLTNTLEGTHMGAGTLDIHLDWLAAEVNKANGVKTAGIPIIIGNPPYSVSSQNQGIYIENLMDEYKEAVRSEKNIQPLSDDYIKFIRFSHHLLDKLEVGIIAMITNNSFISGIIHRGMREKLLNSFDKIFILNLHGSSRIGEKCPDGSKDENVFDIQQGVGISIFIKLKDSDKKRVYYHDLYGTRDYKYKYLMGNSLESIEWHELKPRKPYYFFIKKDFHDSDIYNEFWSLKDIFIHFECGIGTYRDSLTVAFSKKELKLKIETFLNPKISEEEMKNLKIKNSRNFNISETQNRVKELNWKENIFKYYYRPFDIRYICYVRHLVSRGRWSRNIMPQLLKDNWGLSTTKFSKDPAFSHILITKGIMDKGYLSMTTSTTSYVAPLYVYDESYEKIPKDQVQLSIEGKKIISKPLEKKPNLHQKFLNYINKIFPNKEMSPEEIMGYIYAILNGKNYQEKFIEFLKIDYPRIPIVTEFKKFKKISELGINLIETHLMEIELPIISDFNQSGDNIINMTKNWFKENKVFINKIQYFEGINEEIWRFKIGGYNVLKNWLIKRKNREITVDEINHFHKMVSSINQTILLKEKIDDLIKDLI